MDFNSYEEAEITTFDKRKFRLVVELKKGHTKNSKFYNDISEIKEIIDFLVVKDEEEDIEEFLDERIVVSLAPL